MFLLKGHTFMYLVRIVRYLVMIFSIFGKIFLYCTSEPQWSCIRKDLRLQPTQQACCNVTRHENLDQVIYDQFIAKIQKLFHKMKFLSRSVIIVFWYIWVELFRRQRIYVIYSKFRYVKYPHHQCQELFKAAKLTSLINLLR